MSMILVTVIVLTLGVFMAGCGFGARLARLDYESLIEGMMKASCLIAEDLKLTRAELLETKKSETT
jgi:hypothetical protein